MIFVTLQILSRSGAMTFETIQFLSRWSAMTFETIQILSRWSAMTFETIQILSRWSAMAFETIQFLSRSSATIFVTLKLLSRSATKGIVHFRMNFRWEREEKIKLRKAFLPSGVLFMYLFFLSDCTIQKLNDAFLHRHNYFFSNVRSILPKLAPLLPI